MKYVLTIRIPIEARDDIEAREKVKVNIERLVDTDFQKEYEEKLELVKARKLQEVFEDKPPRNIPL